jgi:hypothetical protein
MHGYILFKLLQLAFNTFDFVILALNLMVLLELRQRWDEEVPAFLIQNIWILLLFLALSIPQHLHLFN